MNQVLQKGKISLKKKSGIQTRGKNWGLLISDWIAINFDTRERAGGVRGREGRFAGSRGRYREWLTLKVMPKIISFRRWVMSFKMQIYYRKRKNFKSPIWTKVLNTNAAIFKCTIKFLSNCQKKYCPTWIKFA